MATEKVSRIHASDGTADYSSLSAWEADLGAAGGVTSADLVTNDEIAVAELDSNLVESSQTLINGWTTSTDRAYVIIRPTAGNAHLGDITAGFQLSTSNGGVSLLVTTIDRVVIEDLRLVCSLVGVDFVEKDTLLQRCVVDLASTTTTGIRRSELGLGIINNIFVNTNGNTGGTTIESRSFITGAGLIYNNTFVDQPTCVSGYHASRIVKNNVFYNPTNIFSNDWSSATLVDYNATTNASGLPGSNNVYSVSTSDGVDFVSPSTGDYSLTSGSALVEQGTDLSSAFTDDIAGNTRS